LIKLTPKDVYIVSGANFGLLYVMQVACNPGDNILVPEPSYPFYEKVGPAFGIETRKYKLNPD